MKIALPTPKQRVLLLAIVLVVTLFAGLYPKDYDFRNHVERTSAGNGLTFEKYGVAFTEPIIDEVLAESLNEEGFQISLTLGPEADKQEGFAFIAQIHSGDDRTQLVIGRWSEYLIVMNGDDYKHRLKHPRISARLSETQRNKGVEILIQSGSRGSVIELKDLLVVRRSNVKLAIPSSPHAARIVLGNSVGGTHSWAGEMRRFEIRPAGATSDPIVAFDMDQIAGNKVPDSGAVGGVLNIPRKDVIVERDLLEWPINHQFELNRSFVSDFILNLFGFVPFGVALTGVLRWRGFPRVKCLITVSLAAVLVSLLIEYAQTWVPSRSSSLLDLVLNIVGGTVGVFVWDLFFRSADTTKKAG